MLQTNDLLIDNDGGSPTLVLAHGAGAPKTTPFLTKVARSLAERGVRVVRFDFDYLREGRRAPDKTDKLLACFRRAIELCGAPATELFLGGKSMGGRMATMIADEVEARGVVVFGYPFHPPGKPTQLRTAHLEQLQTKTLIVQGERDPFGTREEIAGYRLSKRVRVVYAEDGDHSLKPRRASGRSERQNVDEAIDEAARFLGGP